MKRYATLFLSLLLTAGMLVGCGGQAPQKDDAAPGAGLVGQAVQIALSDDGITVDGQAATDDSTQAVYTAHDIVYYEAGHDFTYGEGTQADAHTKEEADAHTVVHITRPGQYVLSGTLSRGQIAVDLGAEAAEDPDAVVTLVLNGVDINCEVAPAVIFYNVYECGEKDTETATKDVDTTAAGANVILADDSQNTVTGAYVARIYKPDSVELNDDGTEVAEAKKLHKYDGAFYSKMSMNIGGGAKGNGTLFINADNEGLDTELHLTINGGNIEICSGNDGINTNEDYVSVTTINGGTVTIRVDGATGEGDGIDSNGWLVINGGAVFAEACATSGDAGIDSDMGIHINGGTVVASGNMLDRIGESKQSFAVFQCSDAQESGRYTLKDETGETVLEREITNRFLYLILSDEALGEGAYSLWCREVRLQGSRAADGGMGGNMMGGMKPPGGMEGMTPPDGMEGMTPPDGMEGMIPPDGEGGMKPPEGEGRPTRPEDGGEMVAPEGGGRPNRPFDGEWGGAVSDVFEIQNGENYFSSVSAVAE